jgi:RNA polymerase sigma-70 factor, ECF subfamily
MSRTENVTIADLDARSARPSFAEVYEAGAPYVYRTLRRLGVEEADCADATQEAFVEVHRLLPTYEPRGRVRGWLAAVCAYIAARWREQYGKRPRAERHADAGAVPGPGDLESAAGKRALALALLRELELERAVVLVLHVVDQMTTREISKALAIPKGTVDTRLRLAREDFTAAHARLEARAAGPRPGARPGPAAG